MSFFTFLSPRSPEEEFWKWFVANENQVFNFENNQERIFNELHSELLKIHSSLVFEIGTIVDGVREFVISADRDREAFPWVERLFNQAPELSRWRFTKFRPRIGTGFRIRMNGRNLSAEDISFILEPYDGLIGVELFIDGYEEQDSEVFERMALILLDSALGEYDVETKIGYVEVKAIDLERIIETKPFDELPETFDKIYSSSLN